MECQASVTLSPYIQTTLSKAKPTNECLTLLFTVILSNSIKFFLALFILGGSTLHSLLTFFGRDFHSESFINKELYTGIETILDRVRRGETQRRQSIFKSFQ